MNGESKICPRLSSAGLPLTQPYMVKKLINSNLGKKESFAGLAVPVWWLMPSVPPEYMLEEVSLIK